MPDNAAIEATDAALAELARLGERHGPLMLFQSGGCCDGSSPLCLHEGELLVGPNDLRLGDVAGVPFYIDAEQYERWNRPAFLLDVVVGRSDTFSLENVDDVHFVTVTQVCAIEGPLAPIVRDEPADVGNRKKADDLVAGEDERAVE